MKDSFHPPSMDTSYPPMVYLKSQDGLYNSSIPNAPQWLSDTDDPDSETSGWRTLLTATPLTTLNIPDHHLNHFRATNVSYPVIHWRNIYSYTMEGAKMYLQWYVYVKHQTSQNHNWSTASSYPDWKRGVQSKMDMSDIRW